MEYNPLVCTSETIKSDNLEAVKQHHQQEQRQQQQPPQQQPPQQHENHSRSRSASSWDRWSRGCSQWRCQTLQYSNCLKSLNQDDIAIALCMPVICSLSILANQPMALGRIKFSQKQTLLKRARLCHPQPPLPTEPHPELYSYHR